MLPVARELALPGFGAGPCCARYRFRGRPSIAAGAAGVRPRPSLRGPGDRAVGGHGSHGGHGVAGVRPSQPSTARAAAAASNLATGR
jgi:hypothetical protein